MVKAVFTHKPGSIYDDLPEERYHFPRMYRRQVEAAQGDFIIYYEPRREGIGDSGYRGRQAYVATGRVMGIREDPHRPDHFYALIENCVPFAQPVPFRIGGDYYEHQLRRLDGGTNRGAFGRAVRLIEEAEYEAIVRAGVAAYLQGAEAASFHGPGLAEPPAFFERSIVEQLVRRPFRDAAFARVVQDAYGQTCAFTGLRIINGGGRAEAEAAHIRPVSEHGPDSVRNGIALCGTVHWMFDRGLISIAPDSSILVAGRGLPDQVRRMFNPDGKVRMPRSQLLRPAPVFLDYHRSEVFKG
jgi:putative restriction endonuclease